MDTIERVGWTEALHPRQGGKFAPKGSGTTAAKKDDGGGLSYNGRTGAGYGKKGGDNRVSALQAELNRLGFTDGAGNKLAKDGKLGPRTTAAIKKAQRKLGLKPDGVATPRLLQALKAAGKGKAAQVPAKKAVPVKGTGGKAGPAKTTGAAAKTAPGRKAAAKKVATAKKRTPAKRVPPKKVVPPKTVPAKKAGTPVAKKAAPRTIHAR
jgi:peptidoglycan hydrolase-like protein with peptidoglycan-binding domain